MAICPTLNAYTDFPADLPCAYCRELDPVAIMDTLYAEDRLVHRTIRCQCSKLDTCRVIQQQIRERMEPHDRT